MPVADPIIDDPVTPLSDKHVLFRLGKSWFSVPAIAVREVTIAPDLISVPGCHSSLEGLCRQQSEFIPVISLDAWFEIETTDRRGENNQLITLEGNSVWAIRVSEVTTLQSLETIASQEDRNDERSSSPVIGTAIFGDRVIRVLNPDRLYQFAAQSLEQQWAEKELDNHQQADHQQADHQRANQQSFTHSGSGDRR